MAKEVNVTAIKPFLQQTTGVITDAHNKTAEELAKMALDIDQPQADANVQNMSIVFSSPYGMFRSVPILCRDTECAYKDVCMVPQANRIVGQRCQMEVAAILARFMQWCDHFGISVIDNVIAPKDLVDASLVKDLVTIEVQQMRAENKIAISGDFIQKTVLEVDRQGVPYYGHDVSPEAQHMLALQQKKEKILNQLNATRKDKAQDKRNISPSEEAVKLFQKIKEMERTGTVNDVSISDVDFDEDGNIIQEAVVKEEDIQEEQQQPTEESVKPKKSEPVEVKIDNMLDESWSGIDIAGEEE